MQHINPAIAPAHMVVGLPPAPDFSPHAMALYLRRTSGSAALCFAQAMHEDSAWASERWGAYWADVIRLV